MDDWKNCKNILVIRADNMGDLLMSSPAIRALKDTFRCRITLLTSSMGNLVAPFIEAIDETIIADLPWIKTDHPVNEKQFAELAERLRNQCFDGAVIFTVYSQNPLPAAMLAYLAGIPKRLAYCRENPYYLLTNPVVEKEPFTFIQHQVKRDLQLVQSISATTKDSKIKIHYSESATESAFKKMADSGIDLEKNWLILHPGVSETKRQYPEHLWIKTGKLLCDELNYQLVITGSSAEREMCKNIQQGIGSGAFSMAGIFSIEELIAAIDQAPLLISVNTGTVHIAAATQTAVVVLYALTNPQHTPWQVASAVLFFSVKEELRSKNEIENYVTQHVMDQTIDFPKPSQILEEAMNLLLQVEPVTV